MNPKKVFIRITFLFLSVFIILSFFSGCGDEDEFSSSSFSSFPELASSSSIAKIPIQGTTITQKVEFIISNMNIDEKVGQMAMIRRESAGSGGIIISYYNIGAVLSGGGSHPADNTPAGWADMYDMFQAKAVNDTRFGIPILYGIDAVHGNNNLKGAVIFPHNIGMGCMSNTALVQQASEITAEEVYPTGMNWTFSPCVAVPRNERWGRTYEGFGEHPDLVKNMGYASIQGYQGATLGTANRILACAKHYVGDGGTANGEDKKDTLGTTINSIHMPGYIKAIEAGVGSIMISFSSVDGLSMHEHQHYITDVLKNPADMNFKGIVLSDWQGVYDLVGGDNKDKIKRAINAGIDMVMLPDDYAGFTSSLKALVSEGTVSMARIDDAVRRILTIKYRMGLFDTPYADRALIGNIGSEPHRDIARECVRKSLVLLTNFNNILPIYTSNSIHIAGKNADDLGNQCGGWTISWQGQSGNTHTDGTTIKQGFDSLTTGTVTYSLDGSGATSSEDFGIVVIGEISYAEDWGDIDLSNPNAIYDTLELSSEDVAAVSNVAMTGIPVIVIIVSGRPLIIDSILPYASAIVAAWLPGTEGLGVAQVLYSDAGANFTGKLSRSWPAVMGDIPIWFTSATPLYPLGWGLSYP